MALARPDRHQPRGVVGMEQGHQMQKVMPHGLLRDVASEGRWRAMWCKPTLMRAIVPKARLEERVTRVTDRAI